MRYARPQTDRERLATEVPRTFLIGIFLLAAVGIAVACGGDNRNPLLPVGPATAPPAEMAEIAATETPEAQPAPQPTVTAVPTPAPTSTATIVPAPEPTSTPRPTPPPTATAEPPAAVAATPSPPGAGASTPSQQMEECATDGSLSDPKLVLLCSNDAMARIGSITVDVDFDLGALLPGGLPSDAEIPSIRMQIARVLPDDFSITMTGPEGESVQLILVDGATYVHDSASYQWVKLPQAQQETQAMLLSLNMVEEQVRDLENQDIVWNELKFSEDGSKYIVSYLPPADQTAMQFPPLELEISIDTETFIQHSVLLAMVDQEGMKNRLAEFIYSGHDEPLTIEAPSEYIEGDASLMAPPAASPPNGFQERAYVVSLSKNGDGDVEVTFSEPVTVVGEVGLYVLDPATGGWNLPYSDGDGTDTLTFLAASPDNPPLVAGEDIILGFSFGSGDSDIVDSDQRGADLHFEEWKYPE